MRFKEWNSKIALVNPTIAKLYNPEIKIPNFNDYYKNNDYYINDSYIQVKNKNHFISSSLHWLWILII
ncbi:hypothetical protein NWP96_05025 [Mycoplasmopsis cynos]|nr:hypothetical protein [Mycoplasmopsis cynos]